MIKLESLRTITKVAVHAQCPDGGMSAAIVRQALPRVEVIEVQYNTPALDLLPATPGLLFADFSPPPERADEFLAAGAMVLDHHKGAQSVVQRFVEVGRGVFGDETTAPGVSGAVLAYEHVYLPLRGQDHALDHFARLIGIRDTWHKSSTLWDEAGIASSGFRAFPLDWWLTHKPMMDDTVWTLGKASVDGRAKQVKEALGQVVVVSVGGKRFGIFSDPKSLVSDLAELTRQEGVCDALVAWFIVADKPGELKLVLSCRSSDGVDVAAFCKAHGGGGHTRAAGCKVDMKLGTAPYQAVIDLLVRFYEP